MYELVPLGGGSVYELVPLGGGESEKIKWTNGD